MKHTKGCIRIAIILFLVGSGLAFLGQLLFAAISAGIALSAVAAAVIIEVLIPKPKKEEGK